VEQSENITELAKALHAAQTAIQAAKKDAKANYGMYADINSVIDAIRSPCEKNGLSVVQLPGTALDGTPTLTTQIIHTSGQWIRSETPLRCKDMNDPQKIGGAITYFRRYMLTAGFRIGGEDDDGNSASQSDQSWKNTQTIQPAAIQKSTGNKNDVGEWVLPFKKFAGKRFSEVPFKDLANYADWIKREVPRPSPDQGRFLMLVEEASKKQLIKQPQQLPVIDEPPFPSADDLPF